ncbi:MAG: HEAT repeat domain-containing protein [Myxococcales bacterium]|nr:HEAT repeat domain-containing protein [Myxococcales bacterium]
MSFLMRARVATTAAVLRDLESAETRVQREAIAAAPGVAREEGSEARARIVSVLARILGSEAPAMVRGDAAFALADLGAREALPALIAAAESDHDLVRELAVSALGELGDAEGLAVVERALRDEQPEVRFQAIVAYPRVAKGAVAPDRIWATLRRGLDDADEEVEVRAAEACAELAAGDPLPPAIADRLARLAGDTAVGQELRLAAATALGDSGDARGAPVLLAVVDGSMKTDERRTFIALELCGELGLRAAIPTLRAAVFGLRARFGDPSRRTTALLALCRLGDEEAIAVVLDEIERGSYARRAVALGIAGHARLTVARGAIEQLRGRESLADPEAVEDALASLEGGSKSP